MIYPKNFEQKVGFDKIRELIREKCLSTAGELYVDKIRFNFSFEVLIRLLQQVDEFKQILLLPDNFPSSDYFDLSPELNRIKIEGTIIEQSQLFDLKTSLQTITDCTQYILKLPENEFPTIHDITRPVFIDSDIINIIDRIIDDKGIIKDTASPDLKDIRNRLHSKISSIDRKINATLKNAKKAGWVNDDAEASIRNGRLVIPVPASHKRQLRGFIHDQSATGQTVYLEPEDVFETNNEIRELEGEERREIVRILKNITDFIRPEIESLLGAYKFLGLIDFIRAKAKIAILLNSIKPSLENQCQMEWAEAVHPLLYVSHKKLKKPVIPLDLRLDEKQRILVISGPNAGGKSVCLKTVGLLQYMLQCGLLIPIKEGSTAGLFKNLFIDIGDEQSLENDLSTYSSHLMNMKHFALNANSQTLFLIDEFGTGTEPQLGGAIAEAILEKLNDKKAFGVVTTHYTNLKLLAGKENGIVNGAMLFDTNEMQPLYQLSIGKPGSSFAFEIARKIGFPKSILKQAEHKTGKKQLDFDQQLQQLEIEKSQLAESQEKFKVADGFLSEMIDKYERLTKQLESKKTEIISNAQQEAMDLIHSSNKKIENTIREIRQSQAEKARTKELRKKLKEEEERIGKLKAKDPEKKAINKKNKNLIEETANSNLEIEQGELNDKIEVGDLVLLVEQDVTGEVLQINDDDVVVGFNSITFKTQLDKVKKKGGDEKKTIRSEVRKSKYGDI